MTPGSRRRTMAAMAAWMCVLASAADASAQDADACVQASNAAVSAQEAHHLLQARASLAVCASSSCPDVVRQSCARRLEEVRGLVPSIVVVARDTSGHDVASATLRIDGGAPRVIGADSIELDPGAHELRVEAPGMQPAVEHVVVREGERAREHAFTLQPAAPAPAPTAAAPAAGPLPPAAAAPTADTGVGGAAAHGDVPATGESASGTGGGPDARRTVGWVVGGLGVALLVEGAVLGAVSMADHQQYEGQCGAHIGAPEGQCTLSGVLTARDASTTGTLSTVSMVAGAAALAGGVVLLTLGPSRGGAQVGVGPARLTLQGRF
jgi:hypothetical protein